MHEAFRETLAFMPWKGFPRRGVLFAGRSLFPALWLLAIGALMTVAAAATAAASALSTFTWSLRTLTRLALLYCGKILDLGRILLPGFLPRRARMLLAILMLLALTLFLPATFLPATVWRRTFWSATFLTSTFLAAAFLTAAFLTTTAGLLIAAAAVAFRLAVAPRLLGPAVAAMFVAAAVGTPATASPVVALLFTVRAAALLVARTRLGGLRLDFGFAR